MKLGKLHASVRSSRQMFNASFSQIVILAHAGSTFAL